MKITATNKNIETVGRQKNTDKNGEKKVRGGKRKRQKMNRSKARRKRKRK